MEIATLVIKIHECTLHRNSGLEDPVVANREVWVGSVSDGENRARLFSGYAGYATATYNIITYLQKTEHSTQCSCARGLVIYIQKTEHSTNCSCALGLVIIQL